MGKFVSSKSKLDIFSIRDAPNPNIRIRADLDSRRVELDRFGFEWTRFLPDSSSRESELIRIRICDKIRSLITVTERTFDINCPLNYIACTRTVVMDITSTIALRTSLWNDIESLPRQTFLCRVIVNEQPVTDE